MGIRNGTLAALAAYLKKLRGKRRAVEVTAIDISEALGIPRRSAYNALQGAVRNEVVSRTGDAKSQPRGRPAPVYRYPAA